MHYLIVKMLFKYMLAAVADLGGFQRFPRKPPLKNDCVTIKCFNYRGVRLDRDTLIEQSQ